MVESGAMHQLNPNFSSLENSYLFQKIAAKKEASPRQDLINLGIGDISEPLPSEAVEALQKAAIEMAQRPIGYGPANGYLFLREKLAIHSSPDEVFISDGAKRDSADLAALFHPNTRVGICDPVYPVYRDANLLLGRSITYIPCLEENSFVPLPPKEHLDLIYLCSPHNPTGVAMNREELKEWVDYALEHKAIIIFDTAYAPFIISPDVPTSIYEIEGAERCAIELGSFSKGARFTGLRCAWSIIPKALGQIHAAWARRQSIHTNGVSYPVQRAAEAVCQKIPSTNGIKEATKELKMGLEKRGWRCFGGIDAPYIWAKPPTAATSWEIFDQLLNERGIICTPGSGFGSQGEGFVRFSAFGGKETVQKALRRLEAMHAL